MMTRIAISPVGAANVVRMMGQLAGSKKLPFSGIGVFDGDQPTANGCAKLPGAEAPGRVVFMGLKAQNWSRLHERFGIGAGDLHSYLDDTVLRPDHHRWPALVGNRVLKSAASVWETLATEWCRVCLADADRDALVGAIRGALPGHTHQ
jgi:hypothetical protein